MKFKFHRLDSNLKRPANYMFSYLIGLVTFIPLILLNCRWDTVKFIPIWNSISWYLTFNFLVLFPFECILAENLIKKHYHDQKFYHEDLLGNGKIKDYHPDANGTGLLIDQIDGFPEFGNFDWSIRSTTDLLGVVFAPLVLVTLGIVFGLQHLKTD